jgi:hypothetical protein
MRADIHDGPEHNTLQSEAGYIDARPQPAKLTKPLATRGRTIHSGQTLHFDGRPATSDFTSTPDMSLHRANRRGVPTTDDRHCSKKAYPIISSAIASNVCGNSYRATSQENRRVPRPATLCTDEEVAHAFRAQISNDCRLVDGRRFLSIARRNDRGGLHHEDHASFGRARTVHHSFWNDEALTRQKVDRALFEIDDEASA